MSGKITRNPATVIMRLLGAEFPFVGKIRSKRKRNPPTGEGTGLPCRASLRRRFPHEPRMQSSLRMIRRVDGSGTGSFPKE